MIRRIFVTGLAAIIPIVITAYVVVGLFSFADRIPGKFINHYFYTYFGYQIPGLGIILSLLIIFIIGLILKLSRMRISRLLEKLILKIPLVKSVYFPVKRMVDFLFLSQPSRFKAVVLIEYPRKGIYSIGFVTNQDPRQFREKFNKKLYVVFIPSSPSPLTGFTIIIPQDDLTFLNMTVEEAVRIIVSGGVISPDEKTL